MNVHQDLSSGAMYSPLWAGMTPPPPLSVSRPPSAPSATLAHKAKASRLPAEPTQRLSEPLSQNIAHRLCRLEAAQTPLTRTASAPK